MFYEDQEELKVACPKCKSENIYVGITLDIKPDDNIKCNDCSYSQLASSFMEEWQETNKDLKQAND